MNAPLDLPVLSFTSQKKWAEWLAKNHSDPKGIWLRIFKKASGKKTVTYAEALDEALCYGWIDGQKKSYDAESWIQRFTQRRAKSEWSKVNTSHAERLIAAGKMQLSGRLQIEAAQRDGRWERAYHSQSMMTIPADFLAELKKNKKAAAFFTTLNKSNIYSIAYRLQTAKTSETRQKRFEKILDMLQKGEKFY